MHITIYSKDSCSHCVRAKSALDERKIPYTELKLGRDFDREALLSKVPTARTFPVVLVEGKHIGGADQLLTFLGKTY